MTARPRARDLHSPAVKPADLGAIVDRNIALGAFDGVALAVLRGGEPVYERFAGDAAPGLPAGPNVLWPLASITKLLPRRRSCASSSSAS